MYGERFWCMVRGSGVWLEVLVCGERFWCMVRGSGVW